MLQWGAGARSCIGKNLAIIELLPVIVELYRHFQFKLADDTKEWRVSGTWITRQTQMDMIVSRKVEEKS
jgi:cytochrome P450